MHLSALTLWSTLIIVGLLTLAIRLSFILFFAKRSIPVLLLKAFRFVPAAVLSALILPDLLVSKGTINLGLSNFRLFAGLLALIVAWRTKNVLLTVVVGMGTFLVLQFALR